MDKVFKAAGIASEGWKDSPHGMTKVNAINKDQRGLVAVSHISKMSSGLYKLTNGWGESTGMGGGFTAVSKRNGKNAEVTAHRNLADAQEAALRHLRTPMFTPGLSHPRGE
jgi:hypothetical protein